MLILFATMTRNAEDAAKIISRKLKDLGQEATVANIADFSPESLPARNEPVGFVVSTWGDGEPPDEAVEFWERLQDLDEAAMREMCYAVYALGDSSYDDFCAFGRNLDEELERKGAIRIAARADSDCDYEEFIDEWVRDVFAALQDEFAM